MVIDGNAGVKKAVRHKFPQALVQRCQVHKMRNIMNKLPQSVRPALKKLIYKAFCARTHKKGLEEARAIIAQYRDAFPAAMKCLEQDLEECLTVLKFPYAHRMRIRTTNLLERLFGEGRRRTKIIPRFTSESSGMALFFAVLVDASEGWRGVRVPPHIEERIRQLAVDPDSEWDDPDQRVAA